MNIMKGIGASDGFAVAKVFKFATKAIKIKKSKVVDQELAIQKVQTAIQKAIEEIKVLKHKAMTNLNSEIIEIFDAHIVIASDPLLLKTIISKIKVDSFNPLAAVSFAINTHVNEFIKIDDPYIRERIIDIQDVGNRILDILAFGKSQSLLSIKDELIIVADDLTPSNTALLDKKYVKGFLINKGGITSHTAILARSLQIPAVVGLKNITKKLKDNDIVAIDGGEGQVLINPNDKDKKVFLDKSLAYQQKYQEWLQFKGKESLTKDGKKIKIFANVDLTKDIEKIQDNDAEGIGLFRSEFLYMNAKNWPSETEQFQEYQKILKIMHPKQVIIRTFDIGGDKKLPYYQFDQEDNPFLGYRSIRFSLHQKDIFKTQLKALLKASYYGNLAIMFPMIATIEELFAAKKIVKECQKELKQQKIKTGKKIAIGMMVETPAVAVLADQFAQYVDFFSIGTNDLIQYTMAADRINAKVASLYQPLNPSILTMIKSTIDGAHKYGKWVSMCGEMANEIDAIPLLVGMGIDELSVSPFSILKIRKLVSQINSIKAQKLVQQALKLKTETEVKALIKKLKLSV